MIGSSSYSRKVSNTLPLRNAKGTPPQQHMAKADWRSAFRKKHVGVEDMTLLTQVTNEGIQANLESRFRVGDIYTYIGHVLISVNPFRELGIYADDILHSYVSKSRIEMPPHVFAVAEESYRRMSVYGENQCVIISGESGAGKTEAAKKILHYITTVSGQSSNQIKAIKDRVISTNPLLESFGNAKTLRNNNSSRFGKYLEVLFDQQTEPIGAVTTNYLLEKARVVQHSVGERNFHIFYQICAAAPQDMRQEFCIYQATDYHYTSQGRCNDRFNDERDFAETLEAMRTIGMSEEEIRTVIRLLTAILWLGNISFYEPQHDRAAIADQNVCDMAAYLLQIDTNQLAYAMTNRFMETSRGNARSSSYDIPLNVVQATASRDALSKSIYDRLFDKIVAKTNEALSISSGKEGDRSIGILDIYGFEIFERNSFEQLCINYVNEKLQQIFVELTLKSEQEEYVRENIQWNPIKFFNNKIVCDLIEEKRPPGVFSILNDVNATAHADSKAADKSLVQRLGSCASHAHFDLRANAFCVRHYAGDVNYEVANMAEKNKDLLSLDLLQLLKKTQDPFLANLFPESATAEAHKKSPSAADRIRTSASALVTTLMKTTPAYIRCIKPNEQKSATEFDSKRTMHQIKYLGLLENVRVRRAGFCHRQVYEKFLERFFLLSRRTSYAGEFTYRGDVRQGCMFILQDSNIHQSEWQLGSTKVFIRHPETLWALEHLRERYWHNMAIKIQRAYRNYVRYKEESARRIQRAYRSWRAVRIFIEMRDYGHEVFYKTKERRRFSLISMRRFLGDYLGVKENAEFIQLCRLLPREVEFSINCELLVDRFLRAPIVQPVELVMTSSTLSIVKMVEQKEDANVKQVRQLARQVQLRSINRISTSQQCDDWIVLHLDDQVDLVLNIVFKTEMITRLQWIFSGQLRVDVANTITYSRKPGKTTEFKFLPDHTLRSEQTMLKKYTLSVGSGQPTYSVSQAPCRRHQRAPQKITQGKLLKPSPSMGQHVVSNTGNHTPYLNQQSFSPASFGNNQFQQQNHPPPFHAPIQQPKPQAFQAPIQSAPTQQPKPQAYNAPTQQPKPQTYNAPIHKQVPPAPQSASSTKQVERYRTLYSYEAQQPDELSFRSGQEMELIDRESDDWLQVRASDGRVGMAPSNYLERIPSATLSPSLQQHERSPELPLNSPPTSPAGPPFVSGTNLLPKPMPPTFPPPSHGAPGSSRFPSPSAAVAPSFKASGSGYSNASNGVPAAPPPPPVGGPKPSNYGMDAAALKVSKHVPSAPCASKLQPPMQKPQAPAAAQPPWVKQQPAAMPKPQAPQAPQAPAAAQPPWVKQQPAAMPKPQAPQAHAAAPPPWAKQQQPAIASPDRGLSVQPKPPVSSGRSTFSLPNASAQQQRPLGHFPSQSLPPTPFKKPEAPRPPMTSGPFYPAQSQINATPLMPPHDAGASNEGTRRLTRSPTLKGYARTLAPTAPSEPREKPPQLPQPPLAKVDLNQSDRFGAAETTLSRSFSIRSPIPVSPIEIPTPPISPTLLRTIAERSGPVPPPEPTGPAVQPSAYRKPLLQPSLPPQTSAPVLRTYQKPGGGSMNSRNGSMHSSNGSMNQQGPASFRLPPGGQPQSGFHGPPKPTPPSSHGYNRQPPMPTNVRPGGPSRHAPPPPVSQIPSGHIPPVPQKKPFALPQNGSGVGPGPYRRF